MARKRLMYTLQYSHRHGDDVSIYETYRDALHSAIDIILEWVEDIRTELTRDQVLAALSDGDFERAKELWDGYQKESSEPEDLIIRKQEVIKSPGKKYYKDLAQAKIVDIATEWA